MDSIPFRALALSVRAANPILNDFARRRRVDRRVAEWTMTVADLLEYSAEDLLCLWRFGPDSLREVSERLEEHGLHLRGGEEVALPAGAGMRR